jgi:outer membrane protein assembly factor BamB
VYAVDPVGTLRWEFRLPFAVVSSVVVGAFGSLYFTESEQHLYAVSAAAVPIWRKDIGDSVSAGPLVSDGGRIVVGTRSGELLSFGWSGQARKIPLSLALDRKLWQAEDGSLYGLAEQALIALDRSGNERWGFGPARAAAVGSGNIAVIGLHSDVTWLDSEGVPFSRFGLKTELGPQVAVVAGRAYLVASLHNEIWAVKPTGSVEARLFIDSGPIGSVLGDPRFGRILVVSGGSTLTGVSTLP